MSGFGFASPQQQQQQPFGGFGTTQQAQQQQQQQQQQAGFGVPSFGSFGTNNNNAPVPFGGSNNNNNNNNSWNPTGFGASTNVVPFGGQQQQQQAMNNNGSVVFGASATTGFGQQQQGQAFGAAPPGSSGFGSTGFGNNNNNNNNSNMTGFGNSSGVATGFGNSNATASGGFGSNNNINTTGFGSNNATGFGSNNTATGFGSNNNTTGFGSSNTTTGFGSNNTTTGFGASSNNAAAGFGNSSATSSTGFGNNNNNNNSTGFGGFGNQSNSNNNGFGQQQQQPPSVTSPFGQSTNLSNNNNPFGQSSAAAPAPAVSFGVSSNVVTGSGFATNSNNNNNQWQTTQSSFPSSQNNNNNNNNPFAASPMHQQSDNEDMADGSAPFGSGAAGAAAAATTNTGVMEWRRPTTTNQESDMQDASEGRMAESGANAQEDKLARLKAKLEEKKKKMEQRMKKKKSAAAGTGTATAEPSASLNADASPFVPYQDKKSHHTEKTKAFLPADLRDETTATATETTKTAAAQKAEDGREDLANATNLIGTCLNMCPDEELLRRQSEGDIQLLELPLPGTLHPAHWTLRETTIKRFRRSAADYKLDIPELVRPPDVLERVCSYLEEWIMERDRQGGDPRFPSQGVPPSLDVYQFVWDRTRMVRKDFILQNYVGVGGKCDARAVRCHERIARWHAMCEHQLSHIADFVKMQSQQNIHELGQTMKTLNQYYDDPMGRALIEVDTTDKSNNNDDTESPTTTTTQTRNDKNNQDVPHGCSSDFVKGKTPIDYNGKPLNNDNNTSSNPSRRLIGKHAVESPTHGTAEPEMRGLYILLTMNNDGGMEVLKYAARLFRERPEVYHSKPVQLALSIYKAKKEYNYVRFFAILRDTATPYLFSCIMFKHVELMRKAAFRIMSKTYGARRRENGEAIYDAYPLKKFEKLLCFEDLDEARDACKHYSITVKEMKIRSSSSPEGRVEEIIQWRHSDFKELTDPAKGIVVPLRPKKMVKFIESKLNGLTRLAVCRGEVSGDGASLSLAASEAAAPAVLSSPTSPAPQLAATATADQNSQELQQQMQKEQEERAAREKEEAAAQKMAAMKAEILRRQEEKNRRQQEEQERQRKEAEERRRLEILAAEQRKKQIEEQKRLEEEQKRRYEEMKKQELEQRKQREIELEKERKRQEEIARVETERQQRLLAEAAAARKKEEEARLAEERRQRLLEEQKQRRFEEQERLLREKEEQERQRLETKMKMEQRRLLEEIKRRKEEEAATLALDKKIDEARKRLVLRRWRQRLPPRKLYAMNEQSLRDSLDPTFAQREFASVLDDFVVSDSKERMDNNYYNRVSNTVSQTAGVNTTRKILEQLLSEEPQKNLHFTSIFTEVIKTNYQERLCNSLTANPNNRRIGNNYDKGSNDGSSVTTILFKVAIVFPKPNSPEEESMCELLHSWLKSRIRYNEVMISEKFDLIGNNINNDNNGMQKRQKRVRSCQIRTVFVKGSCDGVCDMTLFVIPPPWATSGAWTANTKEALSDTFSNIDDDIPIVALVLGEDLQTSYFDSAKRVLSECRSSGSNNDDEFPVVFPSSLSKFGLDGALESSCRVLVESFIELFFVDGEEEFSSSPPPLLERISATTLGCMCICDAMWKNNDLAAGSGAARRGGSNYSDFVRATLGTLINELAEVENSVKSTWSDWPANSFATADGKNSGGDDDYYVKGYFGANNHLPMAWASCLMREKVEPTIKMLAGSFHGPITAVADKLLVNSPLTVREECEIMIQRRQFRRCIQRILLYREEEESSSSSLFDQVIYLPKGMIEVIVNNTVHTVLQSTARDQLLPSTAAPWQQGVVSGSEDDGQDEEEAHLDSSGSSINNKNVVENVLDNREVNNTSELTSFQTQRINIVPVVDKGNTVDENVIEDMQREGIYSTLAEKNNIFEEASPATWMTKYAPASAANDRSNAAPVGALSSSSSSPWRRWVPAGGRTKRRLHHDDDENNTSSPTDSSQTCFQKYKKQSRDIEESAAFTKKLEALLRGDATIDMQINKNTTLNDVLRDVPLHFK